VRDPMTGFVKRNTYNEGGEILVGVPGEEAFAGYYNNPSATKKKFERDVFKKGDLYYRSGDALRRDDDGRWFFLDRLGDTYRWKSENVSTAEVAEALGKYPGVGEAIVYGTLVPKHDGRAGCVALRLADGVDAKTFDWKALLEYSRSKLEGIDIDKYGEKVPNGQHDVVMWAKPGANTYVRFTLEDLQALRDGKISI
jgi:acyl-CoA synthetase (AMP-forming)/AMP-acid ligase II